MAKKIVRVFKKKGTGRTGKERRASRTRDYLKVRAHFRRKPKEEE